MDDTPDVNVRADADLLRHGLAMLASAVVRAQAADNRVHLRARADARGVSIEDLHDETKIPLGELVADMPSEPVVVNINVPNVELPEIRGWEMTEVGLEPPRAMSRAELVATDEPDRFGVAITYGQKEDLPPHTDGGAIELDLVTVTYLTRLQAHQRDDLARAFECERVVSLAVEVAGIFEPGHEEVALHPLAAFEAEFVSFERPSEGKRPNLRLRAAAGEDPACRDRHRSDARSGQQLAPAAAALVGDRNRIAVEQHYRRAIGVVVEGLDRDLLQVALVQP